MRDLNVLERYTQLLEEASELERMAGDGNFGGPTYWMNRSTSTREAIADKDWEPGPDDRMAWALPRESCRAINAAFEGEVVDLVWRKAAALLRAKAAAMKTELEKHAAEVADALAKLNEVGK